MARHGSVMRKKLLPVLSASLALLLLAVLLIQDARKTEYKSAEKASVLMGTLVKATVYGSDGDTAQRILDTISDVEKQISKNLSDSVLSTLNRDGKCIDRQTAQLIALCGEIYESSGGAFDITTGDLSSLWGIGAENERIPKEKEIKKALTLVDGSAVRVSGESVSCKPGQQLDLGAVGKGYACDRVGEILQDEPLKGAVVSVGGSIAVFGRFNAAGEKWRIAVRDPFAGADEYAGVIELNEGFLSTSGDYERYFEKDGVRYHHILSPETGYPVRTKLKSVTIKAPSGSLSDALSTACFILGYEKSLPLLNEYNAEAIFIDEDKNILLTGSMNECFTLTNDEFQIVRESPA